MIVRKQLQAGTMFVGNDTKVGSTFSNYCVLVKKTTYFIPKPSRTCGNKDFLGNRCDNWRLKESGSLPTSRFGTQR